MYAWIFSHLPGPRWARILLALALLAAAVWWLFEVVFPRVAPYSPFTTDVTLETPE